MESGAGTTVGCGENTGQKCLVHLLELALATPQIHSTAPPPAPVQWATLFSLQQEKQTIRVRHLVFVQSGEEPKKCSSGEGHRLTTACLATDLAAKELNCTSGLGVGSFLAFLVLGAGTTHSCYLSQSSTL